MNARLLEDEDHPNRNLKISELESRMRKWLVSGEYEATLFEIEEPVGYALFRREPGEVFLRQFFVERDRRRQGIGRAAMELLLREVWWPLDRVTLEVRSRNAGAVQFWRSVGFSDYAIGMEFVVLSNREDPLQVSGDIVNTRPSGTKPR